MTSAAWMQFGLLILLLVAITPILGRYMAWVFATEQKPSKAGRFFDPIERLIYKCVGIDQSSEQRWKTYALSVISFTAVCVVLLYVLQRAQGHLPGNPNNFVGVPAWLSFNTAISFVTNTNWQNYSGDSTMSHFVQMAGLGVQNFVSAAVGIAVAIALVRGLARTGAATIGNFWVDLVRGIVRILLPLAFVFGLVLISQGVIQNFDGNRTVVTVEQKQAAIPGGPVASQEAIKELGTNGGGFYNANSSHPFENPSPVTNLLEIFALLVIPFALTYTFGRMVGNQRQGWAIFVAMFVLWAGSAAIAQHYETAGNPKLDASVEQKATSKQGGGNMEGKEVRFGPAASGLFAASTTGTSTGSVNSMHDSFTPAGGAVPLVNIMLGEVSPGGTGSGLYGMLVFAILTVFIAGLMVGRTPEYLGKKIEALDMKIVMMYLLAVPIVILVFSAAASVMKTPLASRTNPGPHGFTEIIYAYASAANNNGSAFAGLNGATNWFNVTLGLCMFIGRFFLIIPTLALAGNMAHKRQTPESAGTFPTTSPLFVGLLLGVVIVVIALTYFPALSLGPIVEHLGLNP